MVLHGGGGDGASAKASTTKTGSAKKQKNQASAALAAGLKEAQKNKTKVDPLLEGHPVRVIVRLVRAGAKTTAALAPVAVPAAAAAAA